MSKKSTLEKTKIRPWFIAVVIVLFIVILPSVLRVWGILRGSKIIVLGNNAYTRASWSSDWVPSFKITKIAHGLWSPVRYVWTLDYMRDFAIKGDSGVFLANGMDCPNVAWSGLDTESFQFLGNTVDWRYLFSDKNGLYMPGRWNYGRTQDLCKSDRDYSLMKVALDWPYSWAVAPFNSANLTIVE